MGLAVWEALFFKGYCVFDKASAAPVDTALQMTV